MLTSEIKRLYKAYSDSFSFNSNDQPLTDLFLKANEFYWNGLADNWGASLDNAVEISPISKNITFTPSSNLLLYTDFTNYERLGFLKPTYTVSGVTYSFPSKPIAENNKYSPLSSGTYNYPRHYFIDTGVVLDPADTPTSVFATYLRTPPVIDFTLPDYDVDILNLNVVNIIGIALRNLGVSQREFDMVSAQIQENTLNNKNP